MNFKPLMIGVCTCFALVAFNANAYMIDNFDSASGPLSVGGLTDVITDDSAIFSTQRDFGLVPVTHASDVTAVIADGSLTSNGGRPPGGAVILDYDGDESLMTCTGDVPCVPSAFLNAFVGASGVFDLTDGGVSNVFRLNFSEMSGPFAIQIDWSLLNSGALFSSSSPNILTKGVPLEYIFSGANTSPTEIILPFTDITDQFSSAGLDLTQVGWLQFAFIMQSGSSFVLDSIDTTVVPVPAAIWLFSSGLIGLIGMARRKA